MSAFPTPIKYCAAFGSARLVCHSVWVLESPLFASVVGSCMASAYIGRIRKPRSMKHVVIRERIREDENGRAMTNYKFIKGALEFYCLDDHNGSKRMNESKEGLRSKVYDITRKAQGAGSFTFCSSCDPR